MVIAFAFLAGALGFIGADSIEVGPMPNMAITMLGVVWIGLLGSFAALIIRYSNVSAATTPCGTDTLVLIAVGVVANDVGAYFVGSAFGRTPLRPWISPNKSLEGLLGGTILTLLVMLLVGMQNLSDTWSSTSHLLMLGIVISVFAPLGDLTESMFKRNLDVKDFGSIIRGHGGVLDRFDGFLFALPAVYYLMLVVEPWTQLGRLIAAVTPPDRRHARPCRDRRLDRLDRHADARRHPRRERTSARVVRGHRPQRRPSRLTPWSNRHGEFGASVVVVDDEAARREVARCAPAWSSRSIVDRHSIVDADVVVNGVVGFAGLGVTIETLRAGKRLALANKESLIAAGPGRAAAAGGARCRAGARRQRTLCTAPVPAIVGRHRP